MCSAACLRCTSGSPWQPSAPPAHVTCTRFSLAGHCKVCKHTTMSSPPPHTHIHTNTRATTHSTLRLNSCHAPCRPPARRFPAAPSLPTLPCHSPRQLLDWLGVPVGKLQVQRQHQQMVHHAALVHGGLRPGQRRMLPAAGGWVRGWMAGRVPAATHHTTLDSVKQCACRGWCLHRPSGTAHASTPRCTLAGGVGVLNAASYM